jgi:hypothetical protein
LRHFLLSLLWVACVHAQGIEIPDCAPASMEYLGKFAFVNAPLATWIAACGTNKEGTDIDNIIPAWSEVSKGRSVLVPIYVIPEINNLPFDHKFEPYRKAANLEIPIQVGDLKYLWLGLHKGLGEDKNLYPHCAVVVFYEDHVHMVSPNSIKPDGKIYEEDLTYEDFFIHTFIVFDVSLNRVIPKVAF